MTQVPGHIHRGLGRLELVERVPHSGPSDADVCEQLLLEFGPTHGLLGVSQLLQRCRAQLAADAVAGSPQALERLARDLLGVTAVPAPRKAAR